MRETPQKPKAFLTRIFINERVREYSYDDWTGTKTCIKWTTTSPGKWVSDTLTQATGVDMQRLAVADEINEILSALISQLLTGILK